jgi:hypothetical protein
MRLALLSVLLPGLALAQSGAAPKQRIASAGHFDLGICFPDPPAAPSVASPDSVSAQLIALRPQLLECLVPAKHRAAGAQTALNLSVTLSPKAPPALAIEGAVAPEGKVCLEKTVAAAFASVPGVPAAGVVGQGRIDHAVGISPGEQPGVSESSDLVASVRLALPTWCDCFAPWKSAQPATVRATASVAAGKATAVKVTEGGPNEVSACLVKKLEAHPFAPAKTAYTLPFTFSFVHSSFGGATFADPALQYQQSLGRRAQLFARSLLAATDRGLAGDEFNAKVKAKADKKKLVEACKRVIAADDAWIAALEALGAEEAKLVTTATTLKLPGLPQVQKQAEETTAELDGVRSARANDAKTCPK